MGGMVAQELAVLLQHRGRLVSLALGVTSRGMRPLGGALAPVLDIRLFKVRRIGSVVSTCWCLACMRRPGVASCVASCVRTPAQLPIVRLCSQCASG